VNTVQLTQLAPAVSPPSTAPRPSAQSNAAPFLLRPTIVSLSPGSPAGSITAVVSPPVGPSQQVSLLLNGTGGPGAFVLPAQPHPAETDTFTFNIANLPGGSPPGVYLARIRVDGAESRLDVDASGNFTGPTVTI
jgi:hypothetical protein